MLGLMQEWPLLCHRLIDRAERQHGRREIVSRSSEGPNRAHRHANDIFRNAEAVSWYWRFSLMIILARRLKFQRIGAVYDLSTVFPPI